jgi:glyoxylase-like metal-dependent hydrolase (beta-lactamase superfamily II)
VVVCTTLSLPHRFEPLAAAAPQGTGAPPDGLEILEVRPSFFVIAGAGANVAVQVGDDGVVVVDAGSAASAPAVLAAIKRISSKPIRYVIDTGPDADHVGGNEALSTAGEKLFGGSNFGAGAPNAADAVAPILSAEGVLRHMAKSPAGGWPTEVFHYSRKSMYLNGEAIEVLHQPAAHTDSDLLAFFRRSDVVVAGDVLDTRQFPVIDVERGGSIQGEIAALNRLVDLAVPSTPVVTREAGTIVVPGHGRLCDQYDVVEYRDMVTIIRDRVRDLIKAGRSLTEVGCPAGEGYIGRYGSQGGAWTTDRFVEAITEPRQEKAESRRPQPSGGPPGLAGTAVATRGGAPEVGTRGSADRPHGLLGFLCDRELALPDGDAGQGRVSPHSRFTGRPASHQQLGSGRGRASGQPVQVLRSGRHHERAGSPPHHLAGCRHAAHRHRRGHADAPFPFLGQRRRIGAQLAGRFERDVGTRERA